jgi:hypothetical protein
MRDVLGAGLWSLQWAVALSVAQNKRTTVQAGHGVGKTSFAALLVLWFIMTPPIGQALVITTAPTDERARKPPGGSGPGQSTPDRATREELRRHGRGRIWSKRSPSIAK